MATLIEIDWPVFSLSNAPGPATLAELQQRLDLTRAAMARAGLSHLAIFADREHFANLAWLTGFDPRFEEALLLVRPAADPLILVGNECESYLPISPLFAHAKMRHEVFQPFSLPDQPRDRSRALVDIFRSEYMDTGSRIGCVGWKSYGLPREIDLPAYIVDVLREITGHGNVVNATGLFIDCDTGLRTSVTADEIARFEYTNVLASDAMRRLLFAVREGITDHELITIAGYNGLPMPCHWSVKTGPKRVSLASPRGDRVEPGNSLSANIAYWGANCCRVGWVARSSEDLPDPARDYIESFAGPYFDAMARWFGLLTIGRSGGEIYTVIQDLLPFEKFGIYLNPGHLIHFDEWVSSPIHEGSTVALRSGMIFQSDIIPSSKVYSSTRMEDTFAIADGTLRQELRARYPDAAARIDARRGFMTGTLGIDLPDEVLPLSNIAGIVPPYLLEPRRVFAITPRQPLRQAADPAMLR